MKATAPWRSVIRLFAFCLVALVLVMLVSKHSSGRSASRHSPFYVLRIASQARPPARKSLISGASLPAQGTAPVEVRAMPIDLDAAILRRDQQQRQIGFDLSTQDFDPAQSPDIVIVVLESLRPELFAADVMPNTDAIGKRGIRCENHYSGGNSTNLGMFSLVNGLEAIWWKRPVRYSPIMNRVFRAAGYRSGFFGGHDDWRAFYMDGFISDQQYDVFEIEPRDWLASDERAVANAEQFFSERGASPKLAVVYLYSTHADYRSEPRDQINQPAAPDGFTIPFADEDRQAVWNRYRNAARTADSFIGRLDASDRIIVVIGDHGESFLEDGTCGHGTKLSKVQNATPAVIAYPGSTPKTIHHATSHIDILPTLIELTSLPVIGLNSLDGVSLASKQDQQLANRCFATLDHLTDRIAIPLRHANVAENQQTPWAVSGEVNLRDKIRCLPISTLDQKGGSISLTKDPELFSQWANKRFR